MAKFSVGVPSGQPKSPRPALAVDLDGTLLMGDSLHEQILRLLLFKPAAFGGLIRSLPKGRAAVKAYCAVEAPLDAASLPFCAEVVDLIRREKEAGAYVMLCTAADRSIAERVAAHLGLFDEVMATDNGVNLKGRAKAAALVDRFPEGFVYAGDHPEDVHVWKGANGAILVNARADVAARVEALGVPILARLRSRSASVFDGLRLWARALRVHQWTKNLLIFVPLILAHQWTNLAVLSETLVGFVALMAITSSTYLINDLADLDADRAHATKHFRPLASGALSIPAAILAAGIAAPMALVIGFVLNTWFGATLLSYLALTLAYSLRLKRIPILDTGVIATLFTLRLAMGAVLVASALSVWLVTFSMFFFFSLAMAKRHAEIVRAMRAGGDSLQSRGYEVEDWPLTLGLGLSAGVGSLIILTFYLVNEAFEYVGYSRPAFLWLIMILIGVWLVRVWFLTHRGKMLDDPIRFALRDGPSILLGLGAGLCFAAAL